MIGERLSAGTIVEKIGVTSSYYLIRLNDGTEGWSYKGNYVVLEENTEEDNSADFLSRTDILKIIVIDVEVGDATLIICPEDTAGNQDVLLIDTGEDDSERIRAELQKNNISLYGKPITGLYISHYDHDHLGDVLQLIPMSNRVYDHGNNNIKDDYYKAVKDFGEDRIYMTLDYEETFSGGVKLECVATNQSTDFDPYEEPSYNGDNDNSIALIVTYGDFEYFTAGDLTFSAEKSLATGIRNVDVYHVNHHGSSATSSNIDFVTKLDPEVSVVSNGNKYGHPRKVVADRLVDIDSKFYQTNVSQHPKANQPPAKYVGDDTYNKQSWKEEKEGAKGTIRIVVDAKEEKYFVMMAGLPIEEATFDIEK
jgi:beta-lactamase superfamily II metal-dependent hydrolase